jgi:sterol desaturase/sphingolipid hydroxylase (fatty acid hydroxylase superfamily)
MLHSLLALLDNAIGAVQTVVYTELVQPVLFRFDLMDYDEDTYDALYWVLIGLAQIVVMYTVLRPLEAWRPVERWADRRAVRADILYTFVSKLGILNVGFILLLQPLFDALQSWLRLHGFATLNLDDLWPAGAGQPIASFLVYLVVLDFAGYWYHRWQHRFALWWELHAVHHSQQQMSLWSDDRNHLLDDVIQACFFAAIALIIGVQPSQYVVLVAVGNLMQSIQHVNARLPFGPVIERLVVSPAFHRRHHAVHYGHEGLRFGCNFGVLFPWWDMLFGTASWNRSPEPTGIADQLPPPHGTGRDYGRGFVAQQVLALRSIASRLPVRSRAAHGRVPRRRGV